MNIFGCGYLALKQADAVWQKCNTGRLPRRGIKLKLSSLEQASLHRAEAHNYSNKSASDFNTRTHTACGERD